MSEQPVPAVMNVDEVAAYLRVATATVYRLAQRGEIPAARVGRVWRFQKQLIDRWLETQAGALLAEKTGTKPNTDNAESA